MDSIFFYISAGIFVLFLGFLLGWLISRKVTQSQLKHTQKLAENIIAEAQREAETRKKASVLEAKDEWYKAKQQFEKDTAETRNELKKVERRVEEKEHNINRKVDFLEKREMEILDKKKALEKKFQAISEKNSHLDEILHRQNEKLEKIADAFDGVEKSYAIQAGREIRILVSHRRIDDAQAAQLDGDISRKIEDDMEYPGQIKVVVIRETRAVEYAR